MNVAASGEFWFVRSGDWGEGTGDPAPPLSVHPAITAITRIMAKRIMAVRIFLDICVHEEGDGISVFCCFKF